MSNNNKYQGLKFKDIIYKRTKGQRFFKICTEDIIAIGSVVIAILIVIGLFLGVIAQNKGIIALIVDLLGGVGVTRIIKARRRR